MTEHPYTNAMAMYVNNTNTVIHGERKSFCLQIIHENCTKNTSVHDGCLHSTGCYD